MKIITRKEKESTRDVILRNIKSLHQATVDELAEGADVSPVTVRHHLNSLLGDGLIISKTVRRKIGRPHHVYSLSAAGQELFPQKYFHLSTLLLDEVKAPVFGRCHQKRFLDGVAHRTMVAHRGKFEHLNFEQKLDYLVDVLGEEGFLAQWEEAQQGYRLTEYSCPYLSIGEEHAEVCSFDKELMLNILNTEVTQESCMLEGDTCCQFTIPAPSQT